MLAEPLLSAWTDAVFIELDHRLFLEQDYAIINPMQVGKEQYADLDTQVLLPKELERHRRMMPLLVHLASMDQSCRLELLERSEHWARHHHMPLFTALFSSSSVPERVRTTFVARMLLQRDDGRRTWLRYHDPRVFRHLQWLLNGDQLAAVMGAAETWLGFDPLHRRWIQWRRPDAANHQRLRLDARQWQAVEQFEALNGCLRDLADEGKNCDDDVARRLLEGLLDAQRQGLMQSADRILFARQQLEHGPGIERLPAVALRLRKACEREASYVVACDSLLKDDFLRHEGVA